MVQDTIQVDRLIWSRICTFDWYHYHRPSTFVVLEQPMCTLLQQRCVF